MKKLLFALLVLMIGISLFAQEEETNNEPFKVWGSADVYAIQGDEYYFRNPKDFKLMGNLEVNAKYTVNDNLEFNGTLVTGNYLKSLEINPYDGIHHIYTQLYYLNAKYKNDQIGEISVGNLPLKVNTYVLQRVTNDDYFGNALTQTGNFPLLGLNWKNKINSFSYNIWGGRMGKNGFDDMDLNAYSCG